MKKTVLITGASSGIGLESALYFAEKGWNTVATMRNPEKRENIFNGEDNIELLHLDVLDARSIRTAIEETVKKYGVIHAVVNNAGYALMGVFEKSTREQIGKQFNTNIFGMMDVIREILPIFRKQKFGTIVNVASIGGRVGVPMYSLYQGTKWAVEGFSEALHYELRPLNIKVKIIEPGLIKTNFYGGSMDKINTEDLGDYSFFAAPTIKHLNEADAGGSHPKVVAKGIYKAASTKSWKLRYSMGKMAKMVLFLRKILSDRLFFKMIRSSTLKTK
jgi:short-subunit dehydrogenase